MSACSRGQASADNARYAAASCCTSAEIDVCVTPLARESGATWRSICGQDSVTLVEEFLDVNGSSVAHRGGEARTGPWGGV